MIAANAAAHTLHPSQVVAGLESKPVRERYGVVAVVRNPDLERMLSVRVDERFRKLEAHQQRHFAESWLHLWKKATPNGVFAVLDAASGESLVSFDGEGRARLKRPPRMEPAADAASLAP